MEQEAPLTASLRLRCTRHQASEETENSGESKVSDGNQALTAKDENKEAEEERGGGSTKTTTARLLLN